MDSFSSPTQCDHTFTDLYSGSLDLIEQTLQFDTSLQTSIYQGMSVQMLDTSFPGYHNQSDITKNNPESFNSLNKYDIESLTLSETAGFFETDIPDIPLSVSEYILENSDNESVNDASPSIPDIPFVPQICLSRSEPEVREPTPESHSNPDCPLTDLPDALPGPQDLRPLTVINPLNLNQTASENQTTRAKYIIDDNVDDKASIIERKRERKRKLSRERMRKRYQNNPDVAERQKAHFRERYQNNPDYAERKRKRMREIGKDPNFKERHRERRLKRQRERRKERYQNDPDYAERLRERQRKRRRDPDYAQRERERQKERYRNDPDYAERTRKKNREYKRKCYKNSAVQGGCAVPVQSTLKQPVGI